MSLPLPKLKEQKDSNTIAVEIPPKRASHIQEKVDGHETTNRPVDHSDVVDSRAQLPKKRKATVELPDTNLPPTRRNIHVDIEEEEQHEEEQYAEQEQEQIDQETHSYENINKKARHHDNQQEYYYHQDPHYTAAAPPPAPPPMPSSMPTQDNEAFSNLIMSWYYAGYYTGLYQARQR